MNPRFRRALSAEPSYLRGGLFHERLPLVDWRPPFSTVADAGLVSRRVPRSPENGGVVGGTVTTGAGAEQENGDHDDGSPPPSRRTVRDFGRDDWLRWVVAHDGSPRGNDVP
jgi:hypothetical protein